MQNRFPGLFVTVLGLAFLHQSWTLAWGSFAKLGPGFWPFVLSISLTVMGAVLSFNGTSISNARRLKLRPTLILLAAIVGYAVLITSAGLILTALFSLSISLMARADQIDAAVYLRAAAVMYAVLIFLVLIGIDTPLWPPAICC